MAFSFVLSVKRRAAVWKAVVWRRLVIFLAVAWTVFSNLATVRDNFLPAKIRDALQVLKVVPKVPWWGWAIGVLVILLFTVLEGAYKEIKGRDAVIERSTPKPDAFRDLIQLHASQNGHDINLQLVNSAVTDWFTVSVIGVRPRVAGDDTRSSWLVRWSDTRDQQRHIPKNSPAALSLCRIESHDGDKERKSILARFFTPSDDCTIYLSIADAWNAQGIPIGFQMVTIEIDLRITAAKVDKTTDRRITLILNDNLEPRVFGGEVLR